MSCSNLRRLTIALGLLALAGCASNPATTSESTTDVTPELEREFRNAVTLMENGDLQEARQAFRAIHQAHPDLPGPLVNLCIADFRDEQPEAAEACFRKVLELDSEHADALNHLGVLARQSGEFGQAEDYYRRALTSDPDHGPTLRNLGILLDLYRGEHREALVLYERYQALQPEPDPTVEQWVADLKNRLK